MCLGTFFFGRVLVLEFVFGIVVWVWDCVCGWKGEREVEGKRVRG